MPFEPAPDTEICSTCRRPLTQRGSNGECLRCLFGIAMLPDDVEPRHEHSDSDLTIAGNHRYGHFEILTTEDGSFQELGAGAMGITYRAQDSMLHRVVAVKVISRSFAGHPATRARFLREARAAAQLRHANVASVFHYGEQDGQCFYAMELVEGETLEARVRRDGPLPAELAFEVAAQVTRALAAAEAQGIVHRDLKPGNIMLVAGGDGGVNEMSILVKVIDFGLAKAVATEAEIPGLADTRGGFVGTPAFASPEQYARGQDERIDTRSDIYSLGVTLWYLLCGKLPFVGQTLTEIHEQQTCQPLPLEQLKAANVPAPLVALLRSMLAVAPASRPQSARELSQSFSRCQAQLSGSGTARRRWLVGGATVGSILCLAAVLGLPWRREIKPVAMPVDASIAVLPFENLSPAKEEAFFTHGVHDAIAADLGYIAQVKVTGSSSVKTYPSGKPRDLPAIAQALRVDHLLEGSVRRDDDRVHIALRLTDLRDAARNWTAKYDRPLTEEFALLSEITRAVAERLHAPPSAAEAAVINRRPTQDPGAYDLYLRSRETPSIYRTEAELRQADEHSITLLNEAVARDPNFVFAYCVLAGRHDDIANNPQGASAAELAVDHWALAEAALAQANRLQPDAGEVHAAFATHYFGLRDFARARTEADLARRSLPNNVVVETLTGRIARQQGRWHDSVRALEKAVALDPRQLSSHLFLEETYAAVRDYDGAAREFVAMESLLPPGAAATLAAERAILKLDSQADLAPLRAALAEIKDAQDPDHEVRTGYGLMLTLFDHNASHVSYMLAASKQEQVALANFVYPKAWYEALAARMRKDDAAAQAAFNAARSMVEQTVLANPRDERNLLLLAMIDAGLGRKDDAVSEAQRACAMTPLDAERNVGPSDRCCLAVVYAWTNQPDLALAELDKLASGPAGVNTPDQPTYGDLRLNPLWDSLRDDPRFEAITQRLAPR